jgi:hypothetical protein
VPHGCSCGPSPDDLPVPLLKDRLVDDAVAPSLMGLTVDFDAGVWRGPQMAEHLMEWVLDFALRHSERTGFAHGRALDALRSAIRRTFGNGNDRGLPGEILLHLACRQFYGSDTVIAKVFFKTATNDVVKGFDSVHVVHGQDGLELWLGEAKFYSSLPQAVRDVVKELEQHLGTDYLQDERLMIASKIEDVHPHADELRNLLHKNTPLEELFTRVTIPVLLTFNSDATQAHTSVSQDYKDQLEEELRKGWTYFQERVPPNLPVTVRLILVPLATKKILTAALDEELRQWR